MLRGIEQRIESLFEGIFGRAFRSHVQPVELARKLVKEMDDHRSVSVSRVYVPNEYVVYLAPKDREQFRAYEGSLLVELGDYLAEHARREGYVLLSPPRVLMEEDADLAVGEFGIATRLVQPTAPRPAQAMPAAPPAAGSPPTAVLAQPPPPPPEPAAPPLEPPPPEVDQTRVFPVPEPPPAPPPPPPVSRPPAILVAGRRHEVDQDVVTVGRSKDCDLTLDDASVSRQHAQFRREAGDLWIVDLGSTNGVELNGRRVERAKLGTGDRILLGQTELRVELAS